MLDRHHRILALVAVSALLTGLILTASSAPPDLKIRFLATMTAIVCSYSLFHMLVDRAGAALLGMTARRPSGPTR